MGPSFDEVSSRLAYSIIRVYKSCCVGQKPRCIVLNGDNMREDKNRTSRFSTNDAKRMQFRRKPNNYFQNVRGTDKEVREHCIFVSIRLFDQSLRDINNKDNKLNPSDPQHVSCKRLHPPHTSDFSPVNKHLSRKIENRKNIVHFSFQPILQLQDSSKDKATSEIQVTLYYGKLSRQLINS